jgi:hypothetical protein
LDQIIGSAILGAGKSIHVATLARQTVLEAGADHLGFEGYFVFETDDTVAKGINILGKAISLDAALRLVDLWSGRELNFGASAT